MKNNVVSPTNIIAWTVFEMIRRQRPDPDFYRFLRETAYDISLPMVDVYRQTGKTLKKVKELEAQGKIKIFPGEDAEMVVNKALKLFSCYHTKPAFERRGDRLFPVDMNLVYYYRNRLWNYGLERLV